MHVRAESLEREVKFAVDSAVEITNDPDGDAEAIRRVLIDHMYLRAADASVLELEVLKEDFSAIASIIRSAPSGRLEAVVALLNKELSRHHIAPQAHMHDGSELHVHWTADDARFSDQVMVDVLMALIRITIEHGTERFGVCDASGCERIFYDHTKNQARRFCSDKKCASRTHTAEHRRRAVAATEATR